MRLFGVDVCGLEVIGACLTPSRIIARRPAKAQSELMHRGCTIVHKKNSLQDARQAPRLMDSKILHLVELVGANSKKKRRDKQGDSAEE